MNTFTLVLLLSAVVIVAIAVISLSHYREKARLQRKQRIRMLDDAYNHASRVLNELPGQYLNADLKLLLLKQMSHCCNGLALLNTGLPIDERRDRLVQLRQLVQSGEDTPVSIRINSAEKATVVKAQLQSLFALIEAMHKAGRLDAASAKRI